MKVNLILAVAAGVLAPLSIGTYCSELGSFTDYAEVPRLFEGFTSDNVRYVILSKAKESKEGEAPAVEPGAEGEEVQKDVLVLVRQDDKWVIGQSQNQRNPLAGVPVRENKVDDDVLKHIKAVRRDEKALVAANADDARMREDQVTEDTGLLIECRNAENVPVAELIVGRDASGGEYGQDRVAGYYVARKGRKDVILYEPDNRYWRLTLKPEDWVDTKIHQFEAAKVTSFSLRNPKGQIKLVRDGSPVDGGTKPWKVEGGPEGAVPRQAEVEGLVSRFAYMSAQRYVGNLETDPVLQARAPSAEQAQYEVIATLDDGKRYAMHVFQKIPDKNEYDAHFDGPDDQISKFLVAVGDWVVTGYEKDPKELYDIAPAGDGKPGEGGAKAGDGGAQGGEGAPGAAGEQGGEAGGGNAPAGAGEAGKSGNGG